MYGIVIDSVITGSVGFYSFTEGIKSSLNFAKASLPGSTRP